MNVLTKSKNRKICVPVFREQQQQHRDIRQIDMTVSFLFRSYGLTFDLTFD